MYIKTIKVKEEETVDDQIKYKVNCPVVHVNSKVHQIIVQRGPIKNSGNTVDTMTRRINLDVVKSPRFSQTLSHLPPFQILFPLKFVINPSSFHSWSNFLVRSMNSRKEKSRQSFCQHIQVYMYVCLQIRLCLLFQNE